MKKPLLEMVQDILSEMDSDEVNSLDDTVESQQVATIIKNCYLEIISNRNWDFLKKMINLDSSGSLALPSHLRLPENVKEMIFFRYDCTKENDTVTTYRDIRYKYPDEFLRLTSSRNANDGKTTVVTDLNGVKLFITNNQPPTYWTSFDDRYIVCDSYDGGVDDTLKASKSQVYAVVEPVWIHTDDAVPDLPSEAFSMLEEESKSTAMLKLRQMTDQKAEQKAKRQQQWLSRKQWAAHGGVRYPNYGRRGKK
jgi:hypothetical protein